MKKMMAFFRLRFSLGLQYRGAAAAGVFTQFFWGFMEILIFHAFYRARPQDFPMGFAQLSSYIWLQQAFLALFMVWFFEGEIFAMIADGGIAYALCRPMDLYGQWLAQTLAGRVSRALLRCGPILVTALLLPPPFGLALPPTLWAGVLCLGSLILGALVSCAFCMLIYIATFYTLSPTGVRMMAASLAEFLSGAIVPLPFLPDGLRQVVELTPFAAMQNIPLRIYSGNIAGIDAAGSILFQLFWLVSLYAFGRWAMGRVLRRAVVQGG